MALIEFGTEHLPPAERFDFWLDLVFRSHVRSRIQSEADGDFRASTRTLDLGTISVSLLTTPPIESDRCEKLIKQCDPEVILLHLPLNSSGRVAQGDRRSILAAGDIALYDSSHQLHVQQAAPGLSRWMLVEIPRSVLQPLVPSISELVAEPFCGRSGLGAVLSRYLEELLRNVRTCDPVDRAALNGITIDLIAATCAHRQGHGSLPVATRQQALFLSIRDLIDQRLGDPRLSPEVIAAAHHISIRYLHKLFQAQEVTSVAAWIRHRRLERCCRDLNDPRLRHLTIGAISAHWGFTDPSHFCRLFRKAYDVTPTDYRQAHSDTA